MIPFLVVLAYELALLYSGIHDKVTLAKTQNHYENPVLIEDHNFLPTIQLDLLEKTDGNTKKLTDLKIIDANGIWDFTEISKYI